MSRTNFMSRTLNQDHHALHLVLLDAGAAARGASTSALEKALARAERHATGADAAAVLLELAGLPAGTGSAALERLGLGLDAKGVWSQATLVHLMPTLDSLQLHPIEQHLSVDERAALLDALGAHLALDPAMRPALDDGHLGWPVGTEASVASPASLALHEVRVQLDPATASTAIARVLNDAQMFLHQHPVNQAREARGALTANALWCWGFGPLPDRPPRTWRAASGRDPLVRGLALEGGTPHRAVPAAKEPGVTTVAAGDRIDTLLDDAQAALRSGAIDAVIVHAPPFGAWRITPMARFRFWRRIRPLSELFA
jgi:hypothetical protein